MFGEYTLYSFVVCRNNKRWVIRKRYSQFHTLDQQLLQAIKDAGGMEANLPEVALVFCCKIVSYTLRIPVCIVQPFHAKSYVHARRSFIHTFMRSEHAYIHSFTESIHKE
jgi:hypothetical protein